ncbi:MAG: hypothetical protein JO361_08160 [Gammaproteobacteria bacterium]|nr:hypothetical protein [Gammaproteobacteria bacterium]
MSVRGSSGCVRLLCAAAPRAAVLALVTFTALAGLAGCSLISLKTPERPLSARDLNARLLTRELSTQFIAAVAHDVDEITAAEEDPVVVDNTLRWGIAAIAESRRAATRTAPVMSLLDTWALALQLQAFASAGGPGGTLFGTHEARVRDLSDAFAHDAEGLARRLLASGEFAEDDKFVVEYARAHPLHDLTFARPSVVGEWSRERGGATPIVDSLGTISEALTDAAERLQIYSDTTPSQMMRQTQLALRQAGYSRSDIRSSLRSLDERLARLTAVAESTPALVHSAEAEVRQSVYDLLSRLDASSAKTIAAVRSERTALFADLESERQAVTAAVDVQRRAVAADAARIADQSVKSAGAELRRLAAEVLALLIVLGVIVLGLPFAAGYLTGRAHQWRRPAP